MIEFKNMNKSELANTVEILQGRYEQFKTQGLNLNMTRGKPCKEQLDLSHDMLNYTEYISNDGIDCRNYGGVDGILEAKILFAQLLEVSEDEIIIGDNSSLSLMYDTILRAMLLGVDKNICPWSKLPKVKFICPSPGYDRHFSICELFGIEMITVKMNEDGPDMDTIESLVEKDDSIKGIWCVPKYSNPTGITYSDDIVKRLANMKTKAKDFRIFWDNAYIVHHLSDSPDILTNILDECKRAGNPDKVYIFSSTSKISFAGAGISIIAGSKNNIELTKKRISIQTIGPNKLNQLKHAKFFKNVDGIIEHMKKHANILRPKFNAVLSILERELSGKGIANWSNPNGGYFINLDVVSGCAKEIVGMAKEVGVVFTKAGATFPYGLDHDDKNIRIAPTFPPLAELNKAIDVLSVCTQIVCAKRFL